MSRIKCQRKRYKIQPKTQDNLETNIIDTANLKQIKMQEKSEANNKAGITWNKENNQAKP